MTSSRATEVCIYLHDGAGMNQHARIVITRGVVRVEPRDWDFTLSAELLKLIDDARRTVEQ